MKNEPENRLTRRQEYVQSRIQCRSTSITAEVRRISRDLFISERTVYRDLHAGGTYNNTKAQ